MDTLLVATDLGTMKEEVLKTGFDLAKKMNARVQLVVIINKNLEYFPPDNGMIFSDQWAARKYLAEQELEEIKNNHPVIAIQTLVCIGDPQRDIVEQAIEARATMIVMGTHGRGRLYHALMGGTAQYVVRHSPVPVLVVPFNKGRH
ncbi:universal stress protein [Flavisolibacter nicotianae]|uniref:universal stress protein n=1 Tax=Flavisolibacter nicotianae TaxID=2364882 RepID=UPI000EB01228|nr:universal stress protein [Flavisolibacter nicotianae]